MYVVLIFLLVSGLNIAQSNFEYKYGTYGSQQANKIIHSTNGGYIILGDGIIFRIDAEGEVNWAKTFYASGLDAVAKDNYYYIIGTRGSISNEKIWASKVDSTGNIIWSKMFGVNYERDYGQSIATGINGGIILAGMSGTEATFGYSSFLIKLDENDEVEWKKKIEQTSVRSYMTQAIIKSSDNNYILATTVGGISDYDRDIALIKISQSGTIVWTRKYPGLGDDYPQSVVELPDSGFVVVGFTTSFGAQSQDMLVTRINKSGIPLWTKIIGKQASEQAFSVIFASDENLYIAGTTTSFSTRSATIVKMNLNGEIIWAKIYGGGNGENFRSILSTSDNYIITVGYTNNLIPVQNKMYVLKTDDTGIGECTGTEVFYNIQNVILSHGNMNLTFVNYGNEFVSSVFQNENSIYKFDSCQIQIVIPVELVSFTANSNKSLINICWSTASELNNQGFEIERSTNKNDWIKIGFKEGKGTTTEQQNYSFTDDVNGINVSKLYYRLKQIDFDGSYDYSDIVEVDIAPIKFFLSQNYPNPFNPSTKISWQSPVGSHQTLKVYDVLGREVATLVDEFRDAGSYEVEFDGSQLASGVYYYQLKVDDPSSNSGQSFVETRKLILIK